MFVHLTSESRLARIRRGGLVRVRRSYGSFPGGVFAVPVTSDFVASHQWLRELRRWNSGSLAGVYFRIPDREPVWVGHYGQPHCWMSAAEAVAVFLREADTRGWEVIIPRKIKAREIHAMRRLPQTIGWRYSPNAKGTPPYCTCRYCVGGRYGAKRLRERFAPPDP